MCVYTVLKTENIQRLDVCRLVGKGLPSWINRLAGVGDTMSQTFGKIVQKLPKEDK